MENVCAISLVYYDTSTKKVRREVLKWAQRVKLLGKVCKAVEINLEDI